MEQDFDLMSVLTWGELAKVEEYLDTPMDQWADLKTKAKLSLAMQYMMAKRVKPDLTLEQAENMSINELSKISGVEFAAPKEDTSA